MSDPAEKERSGKNDNNGVMMKVATFIVDRRNLFFLLFVIAIIFCVIASNWVKVENDLSAYLSADSQTRQGIDLMNEQFVTYGSAKIMVTNITYDEAEDLAEKIEKRDDVAMLVFDSSKEHFNNFSALFDITFSYPENDDRALRSLEDVKEFLSGYDIYVSTSMGDSAAEIINKEMNTVSVLVAVVVLSVLIFTSQTYAEVPVLLLTFGASALLASGTNFLLGKISFVSDSVTIVLQLALSIDYAVIFCNRYKEEHQTLPTREADIVALSKAIPEISSSSLTTVGGLIAMMFMQYGIGPDMAICLIKAIFFSLLSVFTLMPGLIMVFGRLMDRTKHKSFIPQIPFVGKFAYLTRFIVPPVFVALVVVACIFANKCPYVYGYSTIETPIKNDVQIADEMIEESFGKENFAALVIPAGDYATERRLALELESMKEVDHVQGLSNTEAIGGYMLTDKLTARQFSELLGLDYEVAELAYMAYAVNDENYAKVINGLSAYSVPLIDMLMFVYDEVEEGYVTLEPDLYDTLKTAHDQMKLALDQLQGEDYSRMLVYMKLPQEGEETFAFLDTMKDTAKKYYPEGRVLVAGESTSQYDLKKTFDTDNIVVSVVSILAVLAVLLFTFLSAGMPVLLIIVIQGAIWMNFSFPYLEGNNLFFMSYLIVSSIQMGANIDYAIVISGRYLELKDKMSKKQAIIDTMNFAFPTIITSGTMMALAGIAIGMMTSDAAICSIGQCLGRGTIISIFLVMFVLPQLLLFGEKVIDMTSFKVSVPIKLNRNFGVMRVDGFVQGQFNGTIVGELHAVVTGEMSALVRSGNVIKLDEKEETQSAGETEEDEKKDVEPEPVEMTDVSDMLPDKKSTKIPLPDKKPAKDPAAGKEEG
ncbi:MAG: MMPL family transporter [Lachnospiraceae bacterium]|nr:MMPL family transporter [Lachnospiraceae bacterium]